MRARRHVYIISLSNEGGIQPYRCDVAIKQRLAPQVCISMLTAIVKWRKSPRTQPLIRRLLLCRTRPLVPRVQALAMPLHSRKRVKASESSRVSTTSSVSSRSTKQQEDRRLLLINETETSMHNSYYLPASTWGDVLIVETSSTVPVTDIGPVCTNKYGL